MSAKNLKEIINEKNQNHLQGTRFAPIEAKQILGTLEGVLKKEEIDVKVENKLLNGMYFCRPTLEEVLEYFVMTNKEVMNQFDSHIETVTVGNTTKNHFLRFKVHQKRPEAFEMESKLLDKGNESVTRVSQFLNSYYELEPHKDHYTLTLYFNDFNVMQF